MDWEWCQHLYGWFELMVHHTPSKERARSVPVFFHPCWSNLEVLCGQYRYYPLVLLLVQWCINPTHASTYKLRVMSIYIYGWLGLMVHHTLSQAITRSVSVFFHPCWSILGLLCGQYECDPLVWLRIQWCINLTHASIDELRGVSRPICVVGGHGISHTIQVRGWK